MVSNRVMHRTYNSFWANRCKYDRLVHTIPNIWQHTCTLTLVTSTLDLVYFKAQECTDHYQGTNKTKQVNLDLCTAIQFEVWLCTCVVLFNWLVCDWLILPVNLSSQSVTSLWKLCSTGRYNALNVYKLWANFHLVMFILILVCFCDCLT